MKNIHVIPTDKPSEEVWKDVIGYEGLYNVAHQPFLLQTAVIRWHGLLTIKLK